MGKALELTADTFDSEVLQYDGVALVDFWATWCGPCRMIAPVIEQLAAEYEGKAKICKVDVDQSPNLAGKYGVSSIPTLLIFKNGQVVNQFLGVQDKSRLAEAIDAALA
ncbi:thioredoxin TrxA [Thermostilla marina]